MANFTAGPLTGCAPLTVHFEDNSTGNPTAFNWDLGNGTLSGLKNPVTTYFNPGVYSVTLTVTNSKGSNTITKTQYIRIYGRPNPAFTVSDSAGCTPLTCQFKDLSNTSTGGLTGWEWDFGDGDTSKTQNPVHNYYTNGVYTITLKVINEGGCINALTKRQYIKTLKRPLANFSFINGIKCKPPETISFYNLSSGSGNLTYNWDFGNGSSSVAASPSSVYNTAGSYSVRLLVTDNTGCSDTLLQKDSVVINTITSLIKSTDSVCTGVPVIISNGSIPAPMLNKWYLGNTFFSSATSGTKSWNQPGSYTVKLVNTYPGCTDSISKTITVLGAPVTKFSSSDSSSCLAPFNADFTDLTTTATQWSWDFGNGKISQLQNPSNTYDATGSYTVKLTTTNLFGCTNTAAYSNFIRVLKPVAAIANVPAGGCISFTFQPRSGSTSAEGIATYSWDLGNGTTSNNSTPTAVYATSGNFTIKLTVTSKDGCVDSASVVNAVKTGVKPIINFLATPAVQCFGEPVLFSDMSPDPLDQWVWFGGDTSTGNRQSFQHVYKDTGSYTVKLAGWKNGCSDTITKINYVRINGPVAKFKATVSCTNKLEVTFTDSSYAATKWFWNFGDGGSSVLQNPVHIFLPNQTFAVTLTVGNDTCSNSITKQVIIGGPHSEVTINRSNICKGDSAFFTITGAAGSTLNKYSWNFGDGQTITNVLTKTNHKYSNAGTYTVSLLTEEVNGCRDTITKSNFIEVFAPKANFTITPSTGCLPLSVAFTNASTTANGKDNLASYSWIFNDGQSQLVTAPYSTASSHVYNDTGYFRPSLKITDSVGCSNTFILPVPLYVSKPTAKFDSLFLNTCRDKINLIINKSTGKNLTSEWYFGDSTASNVTDAAKSFSIEGDYNAKLIVTDVYGCKDSIEKLNYFRVKDVVPSFTIDDSTGTCVPFKVSFTNTSQFAFGQVWDFGDGSSSTLANPVHFYNDPGSFHANLKAERSNACFANISKTIEVYAPSGTIDYSHLNGCSPLTISFKVTTAATVSYIYDFNDGTSVETTDSSFQHIYNLPGKFLPKVILRDSAGCLIPIFGQDTIRLYNSLVNFGASSPIVCGTGDIIFTDSTFSGSPVSAYDWNFGDGGSSSVQNPVHHFAVPGLYDVALNIKTIYGCTDSLIKNHLVKVVVNPVVGISGTTIFCGPSSVKLTGDLLSTDTAAIRWLWQFGNGSTSTLQNPLAQQYTAAGNYQVVLTGTNSSGCADAALTTVTINPFPATNAGNDTAVCVNATFALHVTGADFYAWQPAALLSCSDCAEPKTTLAENATFIVKGITNAGCQKTDTITVFVKKPFSILKPKSLDSICEGKSIQFFTGGAENYNWTPATGLNSSTIANPTASPAVSTIYKVVGFDSSNCFTDSAEIEVTVFPKAAVNAGPDQKVAYGKPVTIKTENSVGIIKWNWSPSTYLNCTECPDPVATPEFNITYTVTVSNAAGCTATDQVKLTINCDRNNLFLPTAFSPNNDNLNDLFYPITTGVFKIKTFRIFNRSGELVFTNAGFLPNLRSAGWDGKYKGQPADAGNYLYSMEIICNNNEQLSFTGNILLLR